ncbi:MAG: hypothetical protein AAB283_03960, partial [Planctomycetota bacterium]
TGINELCDLSWVLQNDLMPTALSLIRRAARRNPTPSISPISPYTAPLSFQQSHPEVLAIFWRHVPCAIINKRREVAMTIAKQQVLDLIKDLPEEVDIDEVMYRLYLRQKLEAAEKDVREGRLISQEEVIKETSKWFTK